jgi:cytochrome P450
MIYNVYFHPLRNFPGPTLAAATPFPFVWHLANGRPVPWNKALHAKYGVVVRTHPDELSFIGSLAWKDIYITPRPQFPKPIVGTVQTPSGVPSIVLQPDPEIHHRHRKIIGHAFSPRALQEQEYILQKWTDLLITRLHDQRSEVNICDWYSFVTFDIIGDLCFGESFRCLETGESHAWLVANFNGVKFAQLLTLFDHFPPLGAFVKWAIKFALAGKTQKMYDFTRERIDRRIASKSERSDFMKHILENNYPGGMTREDIVSTTTLLVFAGSETSALTLTGATYFALSNPPVMQRLQREIREAFAKKSSKVTVSAVSELPYLHAVIQETLRMHPTAAVSGPRQVDRPTEICGFEVPPGVGIYPFARYLLRPGLTFLGPCGYSAIGSVSLFTQLCRT